MYDVYQMFCMTIYRLEFKRVKGSSTPRLCYFPPDRPDGRCFLPSGVCILKTVKGIYILYNFILKCLRQWETKQFCQTHLFQLSD